MGFEYSSIDIDADGEVDQRGSRSVQGVGPYFNWVKPKILVMGNVSEERFTKLSKNIEYRSPVMNLYRSADFQVDVEWELISE